MKHNLKDVFENGTDFVETTVASIIAEVDRRKVANDNKTKPKTLQAPDVVKAELKPRFEITRFRDIKTLPVKKEYVVKGFLNAGEITEFVAKPGTAKSVILVDIGCHIAAVIDWHGRKVKKGLVVFFAAERKKLTERRIKAWSIRHNVDDIPFVVVGSRLNMTSSTADADALAKTVADLSAEFGLPCVLVIIDTVTRTFGAGNQNQSVDMQKYIQSVDALNQATNAHIALIHHSGWAEDRGKGAIDLDGAIDGSFGIAFKGEGLNKLFTLSGTGSNVSGR